uniref:Uncharacterized protein n=1 Tax=Daphnia galeata TaxID=27404 RepID=A0A8J2RJD1_9CRUS|nr:unnamed protein product [Daphnia galeata]
MVYFISNEPCLIQRINKAAVIARTLLEDDSTWEQVMQEAAAFQMPVELRILHTQRRKVAENSHGEECLKLPSVTLLNTSVSYDSHEAVELPIENSCCYNYLKVDVSFFLVELIKVHMGSMKLKLINAEINMYA